MSLDWSLDKPVSLCLQVRLSIFGSHSHDGWSRSYFPRLNYRNVERRLCSVAQINGYLSEPFNIMRSVGQRCFLPPLLYNQALDPLLQKLEVLRGMPGQERTVSDILSNIRHINLANTALKGYKAAQEQKKHTKETSMGLQLKAISPMRL